MVFIIWETLNIYFNLLEIFFLLEYFGGVGLSMGKRKLVRVNGDLCEDCNFGFDF